MTKTPVLKYVKAFFIYVLFWMLYFWLMRAFFLIFEWKSTATLTFMEILKTFFYGFRMDASFTGYMLLFVGVVLTFVPVFSAKITKKIIYGFTVFALFLLTILAVADAELFRFWNFRLDTSPLIYLASPKEAMASSPIFRSLFLILFGIAFSWGLLKIFKIKILPFFDFENRAQWLTAPAFLVLSGACIIPMRGGFDTAPMNSSFVFFSNKGFANQAALNMPWNLMISLSDMNRYDDYNFMSEEESQTLAKPFLEKPLCETQRVLKNDRPNVIIVILESFSALLMQDFGGDSIVTPNLNKLSKDALFFTNFYADGFRTERGLVSVLSGYPSQTTHPVIMVNSKVKKLPAIAKTLRSQNYHTAFFYGGDLNFVNMRGYLLDAGYEYCVGREDFSEAEGSSSKWGAHDEYIFKRMLNDLDDVQQPFFFTMLSMSSHEPFVVPMETVIEGSDEFSKFQNSAHYTDQCIGNFIAEAKQKKYWDNTLIIFVADHGKRLNNGHTNSEPEIFHIPMIWTGGALQHIGNVDKLGAQRDIAATLLAQMNLSSDDFIFSQDLLKPCKKNATLYTFNDGFGFLSDSTVAVYDNKAQKVLFEKNANANFVKQSQALFQIYNKNFLNL